VRVVVAEDPFLLRDGLARLLAAHGFEIAAAVGTAPGLLCALLEQRPDVAVVDVRLPPAFADGGLQAALAARRAIPGLPVVVLSPCVEQLYARELLADLAGGVGYLLKDRVFNDDQFVDAIRTVAGGGTVMDPEVVTKLPGRRSRGKPITRLSTPGARDPSPDGRGTLERRDRAAALHHGESRQQAHDQHLHQARAGIAGDDNRRLLAVLAYLNA
jgi:DNA-binding NarL/FixJ family response regulator